jgi:hypothetical protein
MAGVFLFMLVKAACRLEQAEKETNRISGALYFPIVRQKNDGVILVGATKQ